jgi:hypothetical protein
MNKTFYKENGEQGFPFILPVLRSYKINTMFDLKQDEIELQLPKLKLRHSPKLTESLSPSRNQNQKKNKKVKPFRNSSLNYRYSPHFNIRKDKRSTFY